jgi:hypothetical protein
MARLVPTTSRAVVRFSLANGGPYFRLTQRFSRERLAVLLTAVAWVPLAVIAFVEFVRTRGLPLAFFDYALHARLLVALPILVMAERSLHIRTERCIDRFVSGDWAAEDAAALARITTRASRLLDAPAVEALLLVLAIITSQIVEWGAGAPLGLMRTRVAAAGSAFKLWHGLVALPLFQFLTYRWLWRWGVWWLLLWRLSRLRLRPVVSHPDRRGGLEFLAEPSVGFGLVILALSVVQAGVWADAVAFRHVNVLSFKAQLVVTLVVALVISLGPLLFFVRPLWRARFKALRDYDELALDYTRMFEARWIERSDRSELLGTADIQSLADLANSYDVVRGMRILPVGTRAALLIAAAVIVPIVPVALMQIPIGELLHKIGSIGLGGLPG